MRIMRVFSIFVLMGAASLYYGISVFSGCPPTWNVISSTSWSCSTPSVSKTWRISWQDGNTSNKDNFATGSCCGIFTTTQCQPNLEEPRSFPISIVGVQSEEWAQTSYDRQCHFLDGCSNLPPPRTVTVTHSCAVYGGCNGGPNYGQYPSGCASGFIMSGGICTRSSAFMTQCNRFGGYEFETCSCAGGCFDSGSCSPIVVDVLGNGFSMTDNENGVRFDLNNDGSSELLSWTSPDSDDSWLTLDRNLDGFVNRGRELFGNVTPQPPPLEGEELNGFSALADYDTAGFGGNDDGKISERDAIFSRLKLWQDANHNGISESCELKTLQDVGLKTIDLNYKRSRVIDEFGNQFRYRAKVGTAQSTKLSNWAWDVFLVLQD